MFWSFILVDAWASKNLYKRDSTELPRHSFSRLRTCDDVVQHVRRGTYSVSTFRKFMSSLLSNKISIIFDFHVRVELVDVVFFNE